MVKHLIAIALASVASANWQVALADGDPAAGKTKSGICVACHGPTGMSTQEVWPNLSAQRFGYLVKQLKAYRDGSRNDQIMAPITKGLSDQDIDDLAAYYSTQTSARAAVANGNPTRSGQ
jgi:cytochrome c553